MTDNSKSREQVATTEDNEGCWAKFRPHLIELRYRLIFIVAFLTLSVAAGFIFARSIYDWFLYPLPEGTTLHYFAPTEAFFTDFKIALFAGITLTAPVVLFQIWRFVAPGLTKPEKSVVKSILPWVVILFFCGACFTFFIVVPAGLEILLNWGGDRLTPVISVGRYFGFLFGLLIAGGFLFELPVLLAGLARLGMVTRSVLLRHFKSAVIIILILAALLTPSPDAFTMMLLAVPIILLYLVSIFIVGIVKPVGGVRSE